MVAKKGKTKKKTGDRSYACKFLEATGEVSNSRQPLARCKIRRYTMGMNNAVCQVCVLYTPLSDVMAEEIYEIEGLEEPDEMDFQYLADEDETEYYDLEYDEDESDSADGKDDDSEEEVKPKKGKKGKKKVADDDVVEDLEEDEEEEEEEEIEEEEDEEEEDEEEEEEGAVGEDMDEDEVLVKGLMGEIEDDDELELEDESGETVKGTEEEEEEIEEEEEEEEDFDDFEEEDDDDEFGDEEDLDAGDLDDKPQSAMAKKKRGFGAPDIPLDSKKDVMDQLDVKKTPDGKEICPFCHKTFQTIKRHLKTCKRAPQNVKDALDNPVSKKKK
jgi:hypothetical protein